MTMVAGPLRTGREKLMNRDTKFLFTDIDGTLLRSDQTISERTAELLSAAAAAGHGLGLSSGRPFGSILQISEYIHSRIRIPFSKEYIIANNGAQLYDCIRKKNILELRLPYELVDPLQKLADEFKVHIQTYTQENIICTCEDEETLSYKKRIILPVVISPVLSDALGGQAPYKMLALSLRGSEYLMPFRNRLMQLYSDKLSCIFSGNGYLEIISRSADKGNALTFLTEHLQLPIQNTFAAGDSENDLGMIRAAGHGYAMANADAAVKQEADHVTLLSNQEGGIDEILQAML